MTEQNAAAPRGRLWKVQDVAEYLGVSSSWVYLHFSQGDVPYLRIGGLVRFSPDAVRRYAAGEQPQTAVVPLRPNGG